MGCVFVFFNAERLHWVGGGGALDLTPVPRCLAGNPGLAGSVPPGQPIQLVVRGDTAGATYVLKSALAGVDPAFAAQVGTGGTNLWPNVTVMATKALETARNGRSQSLPLSPSPSFVPGSSLPNWKRNENMAIVQCGKITVSWGSQLP